MPSSRGSSQPRIEPRTPTLQEDSLPSDPPGKPMNTGVGSLPLSMGSSRPRNWTGVSCIAGRFFTSWATEEAHPISYIHSNPYLKTWFQGSQSQDRKTVRALVGLKANISPRSNGVETSTDTLPFKKNQGSGWEIWTHYLLFLKT